MTAGLPAFLISGISSTLLPLFFDANLVLKVSVNSDHFGFKCFPQLGHTALFGANLFSLLTGESILETNLPTECSWVISKFSAAHSTFAPLEGTVPPLSISFESPVVCAQSPTASVLSSGFFSKFSNSFKRASSAAMHSPVIHTLSAPMGLKTSSPSISFVASVICARLLVGSPLSSTGGSLLSGSKFFSIKIPVALPISPTTAAFDSGTSLSLSVPSTMV